ncbi:response regulator [Chamaesiphon sp.]|uniref:response regulator n=1 Tax=Chamaesiphon sp. TaxID=2814140 RepID=UPI0035940FDC
MKPEIDPARMLSDFSSSLSTGRLEVICDSASWSIVLQSGQLLSADCSVQSLGQLNHRLCQLGWDLPAKAINTAGDRNSNLAGDILVRQEIDRLEMQGLLVPSQASQISAEVTKEALESLLWLRTGEWKWHSDTLVTSVVIKNSASRFNLSQLLEYYQQRLRIWQKYITVIQSPHQRPYLVNPRLLEKPVAGNLSSTALSQITQLMKGISLRELSLLLKQDELKLVQLLIPYIRENVICLLEPSDRFSQLPSIPEPDLLKISASGEITPSGDSNNQSSDKKYKIACIDDSPFILDEMEKILGKHSQYSLTKIEDPVKAAAMIFRLKPDLILMDITMPDINGYKLCRLFRSSAAFKTTPIIMVTGNKGLLDKARAKLVGATDYLTKPFSQTELLALVEKYLVENSKIAV